MKSKGRSATVVILPTVRIERRPGDPLPTRPPRKRRRDVLIKFHPRVFNEGDSLAARPARER